LGATPKGFSQRRSDMAKFRVVVWCDHCRNDSEGCFSGSAETIGSSFETWDDAQKAATEYCGHHPYSYRVQEDDDY
jgi:hypothetical protein